MTWSIAEGRRGRRWREVVRTRDGSAVLSSLLLELDPDGRFSHLELTTPTGLLTLHPELDGTLHGNAVVDHGEEDLGGYRGVEHHAGLNWERDAIVLIEGSVVAPLAAIPLLEHRMEPFTSESVAAISIPRTLWLSIGLVRIERIDRDHWRIGDDDHVINVDGRGLPIEPEAADWPLEDDD